ncbi:MAG TPA: hypothetical protein VFZ23_14245 [Pyrinomonadaceae bacterium]
MKTLLIVLLLALPFTAQTRAELENKFGQPEGDRYRIKSNMAVQATFFESGRVKTLRIIPADPKELLTNEEAWRMMGQLAPGRLCHRARNLSQLEVSCPPFGKCRLIREEWRRATTQMVRFKKDVVYFSITLTDDVKPPPGNINLLPGYSHTPGCGIDTATGYIRKHGGMEIYYDIGKLAGNFAKRYVGSDKVEWTKTEKVGDDAVLIMLTKEKRIVATFEKAAANFTASVNSQSDINDFLKMVLSYASPKRN